MTASRIELTLLGEHFVTCQIATIGGDGIRRQPLLNLHMVEKLSELSGYFHLVLAIPWQLRPGVVRKAMP